jgi:hypothetical protein
VGEQLNVEGPLGKFNYRRGVIKLDGQEEFPVKKIVMKLYYYLLTDLNRTF